MTCKCGNRVDVAADEAVVIEEPANQEAIDEEA